MKNTRLTNLKRGKVKRVGFFERIWLRIAGYKDGKRNLPRDGESGWMSPHLDKEVHSYDEFASRMWDRLQVEEEEDYVRLGEWILLIYCPHINMKRFRIQKE